MLPIAPPAHETEDLSVVDLGEGLGHQRDADDDFGSGARGRAAEAAHADE
jgi:hypothetical protein